MHWVLFAASHLVSTQIAPHLHGHDLLLWDVHSIAHAAEGALLSLLSSILPQACLTPSFTSDQ